MLEPKRLVTRTMKWNNESFFGCLMAFPWIVGLLTFYVYPNVSSFFLSFSSYSILKDGRFVGLYNYQALMMDDLFWTSVYHSLIFSFVFVPLSLLFSLALALPLQVNRKGTALYRTLFYLPILVPITAKAVIWLWLLEPHVGLINVLLSQLGVEGPAWLQSESWSRPALVFMSLWGIGNTLIIFLAGLQDIPREYTEAASVDGAGWFRKLTSITLPLLTPIIVYHLVTGLIGAIQVFSLPYNLTDGQGTPAGSMMFYVMYMYQNAFLYMKMGYASAMAWVLFCITMLLVALIFLTFGKWMHERGS